MPLSENEQRILRQIEEQFYENDPKFAQHVGSASLYRHALRNVRWALVGLVAGLGFLIATLQVHFLLSFLGFLAMLGCAFVIERNLRAVGRIGLQDLAGVMRNRKPLDDSRLRDRFKRS
jgi:Ca2+-dependent lipid-binding protein